MLKRPALLTPRASGRAPCAHPTAETPPPGSIRSSSHALCVLWSRSGRMPRESLDAPEDVPTQALRQVVFGQLKKFLDDWNKSGAKI